MTKKKTTRAVAKKKYRDFLAKAKDFATLLDIAITERAWNSAGLLAVHAVISASDAVLVYYGGVRSIEFDHREVVGLLHESIGDAAKTAGRHVSRVVAKKDLIENEGKSITQTDALDMAERAKQFLEWAIKILPRE